MTNIFETTEAIFVSNVLLGLANDMPRNAADRMMIVTRHIALEIKGNMRLFPITRQLGSLGEASMTSRALFGDSIGTGESRRRVAGLAWFGDRIAGRFCNI